MKAFYWKVSRWIGYLFVLRDYYDPKTFTLRKKNSHLTLLKYIGKEDERGYIKMKEIFTIQIRKV